MVDTMRDVRGCPDAETLAAFIDGRLTGAERARVVEHLVDCADCYFVFSESARAAAADQALADDTASSGRRWFTRPRVLWPSVAALAAAAVLAIAVIPRSSTDRDLRALVAAVGTERTIEPRLTGGFAYGPLKTVRGATGTVDPSPDVRIAAAQIEKAATEHRTAATLRSLGVAYMVTGRAADAVAALESATREVPSDAAAWSDLSAAYLARSRTSQGLDDLARALNAADRATRLDPKRHEAWFNRALAIEQIPAMREQAKSAWSDYLKLDGRSPWADEAKQHLARLSSERYPTWTEQRNSIVASAERGDRTRLGDAARHFALPLRDYLVDEVLPEWAAAHLDGNRVEAGRTLDRARLIADVLQEATTDAMMRDVLLDAPAGRNTASVADAMRRLAEAKRLVDQNRFAQAQTVFDEAASALEAAGNPLWTEARLNTANIETQNGRYDTALPILRRLVMFAEEHRYAHLAARARRAVGLILEIRSDVAAAEREFQRALTWSDATGESENIAAAHNLIAENLRLLGQIRQSWDEYGLALGALATPDHARGRIPILSNVASTCMRDDLPGAAIVFFGAMLNDALESGDQTLAFNAYARRAGGLARLGSFDAALDDLRHARRASAMTDSSAVRVFENEALAVEGDILQRTRPEAAVVSLNGAIRGLEQDGQMTRLPNLYLLRGRANERLRNDDAAESDYRRGIEIFEAQHAQLTSQRYRASHYDTAWDLFSQMVAFQATERRSPEVALAFAERGRARTLREAVSTTTPAPGLDLSRLQTLLPDRVAIVSYLVLPDRLLSWTVSRARTHFADVKTSASELTTLIEAFQADIQRGAAANRAAGKRLHDLLIEPIASSVDAGATLYFVPDGPLHAVSFAALVDSRTGRYLIESHAIGVAPSIALAARSSPVEHSGTRSASTALVIGNPGGVSRANLANLTEAETEGAEVAALYPGALLLTGGSATRARFLAEVGRHPVVHFAGHAVQNPEYPWLSRLLLTGESTDDSVYAHEIAALPLADVRLVVLAACGTAAGPIERGEGVLNLARPFMAAGVPSVVAALWDVDDRATRRLLVAFHRDVLQGASVAEALRHSQLALLAGDDPVLRAPINWSGFVALGAATDRGLGVLNSASSRDVQ